MLIKSEGFTIFGEVDLWCAWAIIKVSGYQHQWLASGYDLEIEHF